MHPSLDGKVAMVTEALRSQGLAYELAIQGAKANGQH